MTEIRVKGLKELHKAFKNYDAELKRELDQELRAAGEIVASEARQRFSAIDARAARGFVPKVRGFGRVIVLQRIRSKHKRPDFGSLQMRKGLLPAMADNEDRVIAKVEDILDTIGRREGF